MKRQGGFDGGIEISEPGSDQLLRLRQRLQSERRLCNDPERPLGSRIQRLLEEVEAWAREETGPDGVPRIEDPDLRERLARCATDVEVSLLLQRRTAWMAGAGRAPEVEGPMTKLFSSEAMERNAEALCEAVGPDALRSYFEPTAPRGGWIEHALRFSLGTTIYAGTSEVQRNIIAQRGLGLPR